MFTGSRKLIPLTLIAYLELIHRHRRQRPCQLFCRVRWKILSRWIQRGPMVCFWFENWGIHNWWSWYKQFWRDSSPEKKGRNYSAAGQVAQACGLKFVFRWQPLSIPISHLTQRSIACRAAKTSGETWHKHQTTSQMRLIATANWFRLGHLRCWTTPKSETWLLMRLEPGFWSILRRPSKFVAFEFRFSFLVIQIFLMVNKFQKMMATNYSFGIERDEEVLERNDRDHTKWTNPLEHR